MKDFFKTLSLWLMGFYFIILTGVMGYMLSEFVELSKLGWKMEDNALTFNAWIAIQYEDNPDLAYKLFLKRKELQQRP